jgi:L-alanine-DL-glutamate epimerase-like enolase superfamily enzyme
MRHIARAESFVYRVPIPTPLRASFGVMPDRVTAVVRVEDSDGAVGWGEIWCNFPTLGAEHRARLFDAFIAPRLLGRDSEADPRSFWRETDRALHVWALQSGEPGPFAAALAGADIALHDLAARRAGLPLWRHLGGGSTAPVPVYASGLNPGREALDALEALRGQGFRAFKIKIGFGEAEDVATLRPVFHGLGTGERVMVDVNQAWEVGTACNMAARLAEFPLTWIEEPLPADRPEWEWAQVTAAARSPLAAGENWRGMPAYQRALADDFLAVLQPDLCKWGGLSGTLPVAQTIVGAGRTYCPHFLGGGVGLFASLHLLAAVRGPGLLEVDANPNPLRGDLVGDVFRLQEGEILLPEGPGLGFEPDLTPFASLRTLHTEQRT